MIIEKTAILSLQIEFSINKTVLYSFVYCLLSALSFQTNLVNCRHFLSIRGITFEFDVGDSLSPVSIKHNSKSLGSKIVVFWTIIDNLVFFTVSATSNFVGNVTFTNFAQHRLCITSTSRTTSLFKTGTSSAIKPAITD